MDQINSAIPIPIPPEKIPTYERVDLDSLRRGRRGKHHDIMDTILTDLKTLPVGSAIKIPLAKFGKVSISRLRSAINRATRSRDIHISTHFDGDFFFIWKPSRE
jgi:hypothetical protein